MLHGDGTVRWQGEGMQPVASQGPATSLQQKSGRAAHALLAAHALFATTIALNARSSDAADHCSTDSVIPRPGDYGQLRLRLDEVHGWRDAVVCPGGLGVGLASTQMVLWTSTQEEERQDAKSNALLMEPRDSQVYGGARP